MAQLVIIDPENYVLEGEFEKIKALPQTMLDEGNVLAAVEQYKVDYVDQGLAVGELNDGFLIIPTVIEYNGKSVEAEQVSEDEKLPAFMIIDVYWDRYREAICGKLILLDNQEGDKVKNAISQGIECFMSASETETYTVMDKENGRMYSRISHIKGYRISLFNYRNTV